uniref:Translation initiation factor eIF2B subunit delta n=1 Tax=Lygus hesperus TaxID=30085 RepID=A0A0A9WMK0_LYGHE
MLSNGSMYATAGTSMVAMVAKTYCIPVLVCCETFKFSTTVQLDAICYNEIGDPEEIACSAYRDLPSNTYYDELCCYKSLKDARIIQDFSSLPRDQVQATNEMYTNGDATVSTSMCTPRYGQQMQQRYSGGSSKHFDEDEFANESESELSDYHSKLESSDASLHDWREIEHLNILNILYDVTPVEFIVGVITEVGTVPPTSVPVILREFSDSVG